MGPIDDSKGLPKTQKQWVINGTSQGIDEWQYKDGQITQPDDYSVVVKLSAAAINFRDLMIARVRSMTRRNKAFQRPAYYSSTKSAAIFMPAPKRLLIDKHRVTSRMSSSCR